MWKMRGKMRIVFVVLILIAGACCAYGSGPDELPPEPPEITEISIGIEGRDLLVEPGFLKIWGPSLHGIGSEARPWEYAVFRAESIALEGSLQFGTEFLFGNLWLFPVANIDLYGVHDEDAEKADASKLEVGTDLLFLPERDEIPLSVYFNVSEIYSTIRPQYETASGDSASPGPTLEEAAIRFFLLWPAKRDPGGKAKAQLEFTYGDYYAIPFEKLEAAEIGRWEVNIRDADGGGEDPAEFPYRLIVSRWPVNDLMFICRMP